MIEHVVIGQGWNPEGSEELRFGWQALQRQLPATAKLIHTQARSMDALWSEAHRCLLQAPHTATNNQVLLLAHPHLALAPTSLEALSEALQALDAGAVCWAFDSKHPQAEQPVSYCTWRGMERHVDQQSNTAPLLALSSAPEGAMLGATSLSALKAHASLQQMQHWHVTRAFAHDFSDYHSGSREEVIHMVPSTARKVLDVGGGEGGFLKALKQTHACETHLAEYSEQACAVAQAHVDKVWQGDFFTSSISDKFDCVTFLDVLEHTPQPSAWLERSRNLLTPHGCVVASIPNVGHWSVIADLLEGRWDYAPVGIHCITHLRFFTKHSIQALFEQVGFVIEAIEATRVAPPPWWHTEGFRTATSNALAIENDNLSAYAFLVRAKLK